MSLNSLVLAPLDPRQAVPTQHLESVLRALRIIGPPLGRGVYRAGEGFARHVVFAGCSPHLILQPPADGGRQFSHVALHGPFDRPRLVTGTGTVKPRCPACRSRFEDWRMQLPGWQHGQAMAHCAACGQVVSPCDLDWRGHAIAARSLVELRNVFPGEATPDDRLMNALRDATGCDWRYAWTGYLDAG